MVDRSCSRISGSARLILSGGILSKLLFIAISLSISLTSVQSFQTINSISTTSRQQQYNSHYSTAIKSTTETATPYTVTQQQSFILDGGELQSFLLTNDSTSTTTTNQQQQVGVLSLVTGKRNNNERIIGVQKLSNDNFFPVPTISLSSSTSEIKVYKHTIAKIPQVISDKDALSTAAACLVGIHCSLPRIEDVGGSSDDSVFYGGKVSLCVCLYFVHIMCTFCVHCYLHCYPVCFSNLSHASLYIYSHTGSGTRWKRLRMLHSRWTVNTRY